MMLITFQNFFLFIFNLIVDLELAEHQNIIISILLHFQLPNSELLIVSKNIVDII